MKNLKDKNVVLSIDELKNINGGEVQKPVLDCSSTCNCKACWGEEANFFQAGMTFSTKM